jgi:sarcosine oxidase subunit beta
MTLPNTADIVIVGGGVMGASTLYHLAARGQRNVILLEKDEFFGQGATGLCAGGVRYQFSTEIKIRLSLESLPMLECFKEEIGQEMDYRQCGYLIVCTDEEDAATFKCNVQLQNGLGVETEWLGGDEVRKRLLLFQFQDAIGATFNQRDGLVDPNSVVAGYISAAAKLGGKSFNNVDVTGIKVKADRVVGVETNKGYIATAMVVNAAGPWARLLGKMAGVEIPITSLRRQMFTTTTLPEIPADFPFVIDFAQSLYFHREGDGLLIGMSNPDEKHGFDQNVDEEFELVNLEAGIARLPVVEKAGMVSHWAGLYEVTPDAHPFFGNSPVDGFLVVGGFSGHGFMHGPVSGKLMSELILGGEFRTLDVSVLDLARFKEGRLVQEYNVV